jgi:hypothetical protein
MGERLVIKVHRGDENIASLYYHYGAYSSTAVKLIESLCKHVLIEDKDKPKEVIQLDIIRYAENCTKFGVGVLEEERRRITDEAKQAIIDNPLVDEFMKKAFCELIEEECVHHGGISADDQEYVKQIFPTSEFELENINRNLGLVNISENGMVDSLKWARGVVYIDMETGTINNHMWNVYTIPEYIENNDCCEDDQYVQPDDLATPPIDIGQYSFDDLEFVSDFVLNTSHQWLRIDDRIYEFVE